MTSPQTLSAVEPLVVYLRDPDYVASSRLRALVAPVVPRALRPRARVLATDFIRPIVRRRASQLVSRSPLRLHLGSSRNLIPGWVNIDLVGDGADLSLNLLRPLPFPDGTVEAIFHEHLLEHFDFAAALRLSRECYRLLKPSGSLRIVVPDAEEYVERYRRGDLAPAHEPGVDRPTALIAAQEIFFRFGHRSAYDFETLHLLLNTAGFTDVGRSSFREGDVGATTDSPQRREGSLYCDAIK
jgi:predicted SAM-dependent methyltransferase